MCRMLDGQTNEFRVLAVRRNDSGPGYGGASGGIGVPEVSGEVTFNEVTMLHDVQFRPMVRRHVVCGCKSSFLRFLLQLVPLFCRRE